MRSLFPVRYLTLALLLAVLVRALVPAGYMPDLNSRRTFQMVVCSLQGLQTVTVDAGFDPHGGKNDGHSKGASGCEFASLTHSPVMLHSGEPAEPYQSGWTRVRQVLPAHRLARIATFYHADARGPPALSLIA